MSIDDMPVVVRFVVTAVIDPERFAEEYGDELEKVRDRIGDDVACQLMDIVSTDSSVGGLNYFAHWLKTRTAVAFPGDETVKLLADFREIRTDLRRAEELKAQERFDEGDGLEDATGRRAVDLLEATMYALFGDVR